MRHYRRMRKRVYTCGFCGCDITLRELMELGMCWICARNRSDRAMASEEREEAK